MRFLQLVQQQAGISRRKAERLIKLGHVIINGEIVKTPFVELESEDVTELKVNGVQISLRKAELAVYKYFKPRGMISALHNANDPMSLAKVAEIYGLEGFAVAGRLDVSSEGLVIFSNDGNLINLLTHPRYRVEKRYEVSVPRVLPYRHVNESIKRMRKGIRESGERLIIKKGRVLEQGTNSTLIEIILTEGKKHEIRRMFQHFKFPISRLIRTSIGPIQLGNMAPKEIKRVTGGERRAVREIEDRFANPTVEEPPDERPQSGSLRMRRSE